MVRYFVKLIRDKDFWISFLGSLVIMVIGALAFPKETRDEGMLSGFCLGMGITILLMLGYAIKDDLVKFRKESKENK